MPNSSWDTSSSVAEMSISALRANGFVEQLPRVTLRPYTTCRVSTSR